jgi:ribosomal protein S12 methylthiotransferase
MISPGQRPAASVFLLSSPCLKAAVDIEKISGLLRRRGFEIREQAEGADVILIWGCAFIDDAKRESIEEILDSVSLKKSGKAGFIIVAGCLPEKYGDDLSEALPEVDAFIGASSAARLPEIIEDVVRGESVHRVLLSRPFTEYEAGCGRDLIGGAWWTRPLRVCEGCDNRCTYCSIPQMRGGLRSRSADDIVLEGSSLVEQGAKEIVLVGQDIASYGRDRGVPALPALVERLALESRPHWLRLCYAHPDNLDPAVADVMAAHGNICRYLDLPIQHAAPSVLKAMGRKPEPGLIREKIRYMREEVPDLALRTSVIVGFPGERESDFEKLVDFLVEVEFDLVGVFEFSPQPGTPAEKLPGAVPDFIRQERLVEIVRLQEEISGKRVSKMKGRVMEILVEEQGDGCAVGRSQYDAPDVDRRYLVTGSSAVPGEFILAEVTGWEDGTVNAAAVTA